VWYAASLDTALQHFLWVLDHDNGLAPPNDLPWDSRNPIQRSLRFALRNLITALHAVAVDGLGHRAAAAQLTRSIVYTASALQQNAEAEARRDK